MADHSRELHTSFDAAATVIDPPPDPSAASTDPELHDFLAVVDRYQDRITAVVARFLDDRRDVEEAVQDTFVQAWRHRDEFRSEAALFTWLYRIAVNSALGRTRRRRVATVDLADVTGRDLTRLSEDPLDARAETLDLVERVRAALAALPELQRLVVILRDVEGRSNAEAAELLGLPVGAVKAHLHRGRATLRHRLHPRGAGDPT